MSDIWGCKLYIKIFFKIKKVYDDFSTGRHPAGVEALWHGQPQQEFCNWYSWPLQIPLKPFVGEQKWKTPYKNWEKELLATIIK